MGQDGGRGVQAWAAPVSAGDPSAFCSAKPDFLWFYWFRVRWVLIRENKMTSRYVVRKHSDLSQAFRDVQGDGGFGELRKCGVGEGSSGSW